MIDVFTVAKYFLQQNSMTHKKLQKLCYYAQAWHCAFYKNKPLFENRIEAWVHGPVSPELYARYSGYGWNEIPQLDITEEIDITRKEKKLLDQIWEIYGKYDATQLEILSHTEEPWKNARNGIEELVSSNEEITYEAMGQYYREILNEE